MKIYIPYTLLLAFLLRLLSNRFKPSLRNIPGPALAKYSRLWKLYSVWKGDHHTTAIGLHRRYGKLVRIGPKHVSVGDPGAIPVIYGLGRGFTKVYTMYSGKVTKSDANSNPGVGRRHSIPYNVYPGNRHHK